MKTSDEPQWHENLDRLREALTVTSSRTGFHPRMIEKDYYCSLVLRAFTPIFLLGLVFKGGTALSKVHAEFYRLSEDLDFAISVPAEFSRSKRRTAIQPIKIRVQTACGELSWARAIKPLEGANDNKQYSGSVSYISCLSDENEQLKIEVALREPLIYLSESLSAKTVLLNPFTLAPALDPVQVTAISHREAYAEKVRAALCRREPAIRDFYAMALTYFDPLLLR